MSWLESLDEHVRRLTDFTGRESRLDYWGWAISMGIVAGTIAGAVVAMQVFSAFDQAFDEGGFTRIRNIIIDARLWTVGAFFVVIAAATSRRLHDVGRSAKPACIPAALTLVAFWAFGRLFKGLPDPLANSGVLTDSLDPLRTGFPRSPRVWDASAGELALCAICTLLAAVTALPILISLLRKGDAAPNRYGLVPAGIDP